MCFRAVKEKDHYSAKSAQNFTKFCAQVAYSDIEPAGQNPRSGTTDTYTDDAFQAAQDEWDAVVNVTLGENTTATDGDGDPGSVTKPICSPTIDAGIAVQHFSSHKDLTLHKNDIQPTLRYTGLRACINLLFGPPKLHSALMENRDMIFAIAAWKLDNDDQIHIRMLQTVYKKLTGSSVDPPRFGNHWDDIGFQGTDPATDLRGGGCLGLVNLVYLTNTQKYAKLSRSIYNMSRHGVQNFPFSVMSLNMTRIALQAARAQFLNKRANKAEDIITTFNDFYVGCYLHMYLLWKEGNKTIHDSGYVVKDTESHCCKNVNAVFTQLEQYLASESSREPEPLSTFSNMEDIDKRNLL